jgi:hypothetical protein
VNPTRGVSVTVLIRISGPQCKILNFVDIFVSGLINLNRAFDGDVVAVELLPEKEWSSAAEIVLEDEGYDPGDTLVRHNSVFIV